MKAKCLGLAIIILIPALICTGCSPIVPNVPQKMSIYATFYPIYALTERITEKIPNLEVHCLVQPQDDCLREYVLSDWDLYLLGYSADILLAAGNGLEGFQDQLEQIGETLIPLAEVMFGLELYHVNEPLSDEDSHFSGEIPHPYMSVHGAKAIAENICGSLAVLMPENADAFSENLASLLNELDVLESEMHKQTEVCKDISVAVLNEALFYPASDCGFDTIVWFERESGEMLYDSGLEACLQHLKENNVQLVLIEQQAPKALIDALDEAGYAVAQLNVMSTLKESDGFSGYLDALKNNVLTLAEVCRHLENNVEE